MQNKLCVCKLLQFIFQLSECKMPGLLLRTVCKADNIGDICMFLLNIFLGRLNNCKAWMTQHFFLSQRVCACYWNGLFWLAIWSFCMFQLTKTQSSVHLIKQRLVNAVKQLLADLRESGNILPESSVFQSCVLLKCFCVLRLTTSIRFVKKICTFYVEYGYYNTLYIYTVEWSL